MKDNYMGSSTPYVEIEDIQDLPQAVDGVVRHYAFQYIDFEEVPDYVELAHFRDCLFLGCNIPFAMFKHINPDCLLFPRMGMPYQAFVNRLYDGRTLYKGYDWERDADFDKCFDSMVFRDYSAKGAHADCIREDLARTIHDHGITDAMYDFLAGFDEKDMVAVMGGHAMKRTDGSYRKVVLISKTLTEKGKVMVSGGGPGAMEATHLGAWMAGRSPEELEDALSILAEAPAFKDGGWLQTAFKVINKYPQESYCSLGVPTWFYGHEPATPFATHIAKYFNNSLREDGILTIAKGGVIYSPGAAGTLQEIFQDGAQNHYETFGYASPMAFLGKDFFTKEVPVYPFLKDLCARGRYRNLLLSISDDCQEIIDTILAFKS